MLMFNFCRVHSGSSDPGFVQGTYPRLGKVCSRLWNYIWN